MSIKVDLPNTWSSDVARGDESIYLRSSSPGDAASLTVFDVVAADVSPDALPYTTDMQFRATDTMTLASGQTVTVDILSDSDQYGYRFVVGGPGAAAEIVAVARLETCDSDLRKIVDSIAFL